MNTQCSTALLESALGGDLPADDETWLHRHLESCETCSAALERMAGGSAWCQEAAALLNGDELDVAAPTGEEWSAVDFTVEHLEPTNEPDVLGRLGGYDVLEIIGHGGMGVVLKAFDRELQRCVAIKVLAPHLAQSPLAKKRFAREAQAAAAVVHPHVLAIHQVQPNGRLPFLVMPLVAGESLAERLAIQGTMELKEILRIGMQAAAGLAAAHEQGLVHRDVKPANILLEKGVERAVLTDFGLARAADDVSLTRWGIIAGTPQYMSPEQARGEPLDGRSDLFSLGCVLYEMATGVSPFRTESTFATLRRLVDGSPQAMASLNPELPPWFIAIVDRLLEKDPARRFNSAQEVSELLEGCLAHVQQPANVPLPATLPKPAVRRHGMPFIMSFKGVLVMLATSLIGLLGIVLLGADPPDIAGEWTGDEWGRVVLKKGSDIEYTGTYSDTFGEQPGEIQLKWSRIERRFNGTWREGEDRFGELSIRQVGDEIRGAHTTDPKSKINPATPHLADLKWTRPKSSPGTNPVDLGALSHRVPFEVGASYFRDGDRITIEEVRGTADTMKAGNMYEIKGTYRLASQAKASLAAYVTVDPADPQAQRQGDVPTQKTQSKMLERGEGRFALILYVWTDGKPHLSFYSESDGQGFASVYFGTGDSVLKKGWWEDSPKGEIPPLQKATNGIPKRGQHFTTGEPVKTIACSPDGKRIAIANGNPTFPVGDGWKRSVEILDAETGKSVVALQVTTEEENAALTATEGLPHFEVGPLAFSPDGNVLAVGTGIGQVKLFNVQTGELVRSLDDEAAKLAETKTPEKLKSLKRAMGGVGSLAFSPDGSLIAMCGSSFDDAARNWGGVRRLGRLVTGPGRLKVWDVNTGTIKHDLVAHSHANLVSFSPDGRFLASIGRWEDASGHGSGVILWDPQTGTKVRSLTNNANGGTHAVAFSPDGKLIVIGSRNFDKDNDTSTTTISVARTGTGIMEWQQTVPGWANPKAFSPDGKSVAVLCGGQSIQVFDVETGKVKHEIRAADMPQGWQWNDFSLAAGGHRLAIGGIDAEKRGSITVWELAD